MGTLLKSELRDEVNHNLGDRDDGTEEPGLTRLDRALDFAQLRIARAADFRELFVLDSTPIVVTGTPATDMIYTGMPTTLRDIYGLIWQETASSTPYKIIRRLPRQWDQLIGEPQSQSTGDRPTNYIEWGGARGQQIEWYPIPNQNFILTRRYSKWPTRGSSWADAAAADLHDKDDIIIAFATHHAFQALGMREDAATWFGIAKDLLNDAKVDNSYSPDMDRSAKGISAATGSGPDPWADPFVKEDP